MNVQFIWIPQNDIIDYKSFSVCEGDQKNRHEYASLFARILAIRRTVFVDELHVAVDSEVGTEDSRAHHLLLTVDGTDVGCSRVYQGEGEDDVEEDSADDLTRARARVFRIGRLAILSRYRGNGYAKLVMVEMERKIKEELGGVRIVGSARFHLLDYYRKLGYFDKGEAYTERNTKLIMIEKTL